ncbi:hypothetical protein KQX54_015042 [Cotesia glomerata]|uniref:Uncharacterized protein n=1 Tax=Cotesia glomerata TaxID=32391 RepID=A0AAV7ILA5_COTGL|nr:hypothetical protein KQX54_015042 [Cotesia glomerata]
MLGATGLGHKRVTIGERKIERWFFSNLRVSFGLREVHRTSEQQVGADDDGWDGETSKKFGEIWGNLKILNDDDDVRGSIDPGLVLIQPKGPGRCLGSKGSFQDLLATSGC